MKEKRKKERREYNLMDELPWDKRQKRRGRTTDGRKK